ncbi:MAG: DUF4142 domain-containing protein [Myxococcaceae bacterium]
MIFRLHRLLPILLLVPFSTMAEPASATEMTFEGQLLNTLHEANLMEIAAGRLALTRGASAAVKRYAAVLVRDHSLADEQVTALAQTMNVPLPSKAAPQEGGLKVLSSLNGTSFDRTFLKMMVEDHTQAVSLVRHAQPRVSSPALTALLSKLLPILESHLETALALSKAFQS